MLPRFRALGATIGLAGCIAALDQWVKGMILTALPQDGVRTIIPGVFDLSHRFNTGAAFSLFAGAGMPLLIFLNVVVAVLFVWLIWPFLGRALGVLAAGCVLGGAAGNVIDRVFRHGVVDYLEIHLSPTYTWPTFNIADSAVVIGVGLLILLFLLDRRQAPAPHEAPTPEGPVS